MQVGKKEIEKLLSIWKNILRLNDWNINIQIVEEKWRKSANSRIISNRRQMSDDRLKPKSKGSSK